MDKSKDLAHEMLAERVKAARREAAGLADPFEQHRKRPLAEHLADFRRAMEAKDGTGEHVEQTLARLQTVFDGCGFRKLTDLDANRVADWLRDARQNGKVATIPSDGQTVASTYADIARHFGVSEATVFDFHALRHQFISNLAAGGYIPRKRRRWPGIRTST